MLNLNLGLNLGLDGGAPSLLLQVLALSPSALFDPSDITSIYQARTGGAAGAIDSVIGIELDKSQMAARSAATFIAAQPEISNLSPVAATTGWSTISSSSLSAVSNALRVTGNGSTSFPGASKTVTVTNGAWYLVQVAYANVSGTPGTKQLNIGFVGATSGTTKDSSAATSGTLTAIVRATSTSMVVEPYATGATSATDFSSFVVKALPGNHATAPSDTTRPLLRSGNYNDFDGVDDVLNAVVASNLGSSCSVYHRTQAGANVWLDAQTINAGNYALSATDWRKAAIFAALPDTGQKAVVEAWGAA